MEQNIDWASIEAQISESEIEHLRGDKEFIAFVKKTIKERAAATSTWNRYARARQSAYDRRVDLPEEPKADKAKWTDKGFMRHIFLAYGWLRYKPFSYVEPNSKVVKNDYWRIPLEGWKSYYSSSKSPDAKGIIAAVRWLHEQFEKSKEAEEAA